MSPRWRLIILLQINVDIQLQRCKVTASKPTREEEVINARGCIVLLCVALVAALAGFSVGGVHVGKKWSNWTYEHVEWDAKGDKAK
jgi:hypothetical protein